MLDIPSVKDNWSETSKISRERISVRLFLSSDYKCAKPHVGADALNQCPAG
jgi:hypothetical protein